MNGRLYIHTNGIFFPTTTMMSWSDALAVVRDNYSVTAQALLPILARSLE
jgi:hypothetical protein